MKFWIENVPFGALEMFPDPILFSSRINRHLEASLTRYKVLSLLSDIKTKLFGI